ncbi:sodium:calcium antiporter [Clostridium aminobutyricum]|uniref:Sodium:calcium antiporter n=2 Tax=Clostridium aminobutyricum TaxID=33953 RepID=A0A939D6D9_CLOAM|nr:sodium:calcium antiporter [Clostridium aminobutyricum]
MNAFLLFVCLGLILFSCIVFTNAIEWFGKRLNLGQGVIGSVFAAIGTGLPETIIPILAIVVYKNEGADQIGIGAIAGAPFMLGTLAFFVTGMAVLIYSKLGKRSIHMKVDLDVISRDLKFFIIIYGIAALTTLVHTHLIIKSCIAILLMLSYIIYLKYTFDDETDHIEAVERLYLARLLKVKTNLASILIQLAVALSGIIFGAHLFVKYVEELAVCLGITPLILSMIITPIATELPEKLNSVIWIGKRKDTLALGNITGAMVFQSCFPVVFGILCTPWNLTGITLISAILALTSAIITLGWIKLTKNLNPYILMFGGVLYGVFLINVFY